MNMTENLGFSFGFLIVWGIAYLAVRELRPYARRSQEIAFDLVGGSAINTLFWLILLFISAFLQNLSGSFVNIINLVLDTRVILVPWAFLSLGLVSLGFQLNRGSNGQVDWRVATTLLVILSTIGFSLYYYLIGIPTSPLGLPW
jgi:uncharacterized Tic20 family protein